MQRRVFVRSALHAALVLGLLAGAGALAGCTEGVEIEPPRRASGASVR